MSELKIESRLPLFTGFYNTHFEPDEEIVIEEGFTYDDYNFHYEDYYNEVGETLSGIIQSKISEHLHLDIKVEFKQIDSPKFYNYSNDKIEVYFKLDTETKEHLYDMLYDRLEGFEAYLHEHFTSRSGFIPFYSNKAIDWLRERDNHNFDDYNVISTIIEFLLIEEWVQPDKFYEEVYDHLPMLYGTLIGEE